MSVKHLQILRGNAAGFNTTVLNEGELAYVVDQKKLYIGRGNTGANAIPLSSAIIEVSVLPVNTSTDSYTIRPDKLYYLNMKDSSGHDVGLYYYDNTTWRSVSTVTFATISGEPRDNTKLNAELNKLTLKASADSPATITLKANDDNTEISVNQIDDEADSTSSSKTYSASKIINLIQTMTTTFRGTVATKAGLATLTDADKNDTAVVTKDEDYDNSTTLYQYDGNAWVYKYTISSSPVDNETLGTNTSGYLAFKTKTEDDVNKVWKVNADGSWSLASTYDEAGDGIKLETTTDDKNAKHNKISLADNIDLGVWE